MPEQPPNLVLINSFFEAYGNNDFEAMRRILSPEIEWVMPGRHPLAGVKKGIEEVLEFFSRLHRYSFKAKPIVMGVNDDYVIDCHLNWSEMPDGKNIEALSCLLWKFRDGRIEVVRNFPQDQ